VAVAVVVGWEREQRRAEDDGANDEAATARARLLCRRGRPPTTGQRGHALARHAQRRSIVIGALKDDSYNCCW